MTKELYTMSEATSWLLVLKMLIVAFPVELVNHSVMLDGNQETVYC